MGLEEEFEGVQKLIDLGREKGYLLYDEVTDLLPREVASSTEALAACRTSTQSKI